jgi:pimeloyl-ACP methyl ester carboxylesterase
MKLFYRKYGDAGPPLIIVHGLYGSSDNWVNIARELSDHYEVYVVDQRNHGESPHDERHDYPSMAADLCGFMDEHGIEKAVLMGHSMGGKTVMLFAVQCPDRVESLIVVDIAPVAYHDLAVDSQAAPNHAKILDALMAVDLEGVESREEVSRALAKDIGSERIRMFLLKNLTRDRGMGFRWKINLPVLRSSLDAIMEGLPVDEVIRQGGLSGFPVLFIRGERSDYIRAADHDMIRKLFPTAGIVSIPNSGHWVHSEQPDLLVKNVKYFLN